FDLEEPDTHLVVHTEVPGRMNLEVRISGVHSNPTFLIRTFHQTAVVGTCHTGFERAVKFLLDELLGHSSLALLLYIRLGQNLRFVDPEVLAEPVLVPHGHVVEAVTVVMAAGGINKEWPTIVLAQNRSDEFPHFGIHKRPFRKHHPYWIRSHQSVNVVRADDLVNRTVVDLDLHIRTVFRGTEFFRYEIGKRAAVLGSTVPCNLTTLRICGK